MAEIIDKDGRVHQLASEAKANAGLTTGIIGTALGGLLTLGGMGTMFNNRCGGNWGYDNGCGNACNRQVGWGYPMGFGFPMNWQWGMSQANDMSSEDLYIERKEAQNYLDLTKEYYQGRLINQRELADAFFDCYKRDVDNSFMLYKNQRDLFDKANKEQHDGYDKLNQKITDASFGLYKNQRDEKDALEHKIAKLESKVDVMSAIRPYQDALINAKIDKNALIADFNLSRRTCRMIEGQLVLPNTPEVTGFTSYNHSMYVSE